MKYNKKQRLLTVILMCIGYTVNAQNPIIQTSYTADPAPMVYNDNLYLYISHDEDESTWFTMNDWRLYTTDDMVNWTDHGAVLKYDDFSWAKGDAWAPQFIECGGKFYMYVPVIAQNNRPAVGVAIADSPYWPFFDPLGKPLVQSEIYGDIDPTVFIDDDGQAYLYWGNPFLYYVKLNEDMISYSGEIVNVPMIEESFGKREGDVKDRPTLYEEGPWLYKRNKLYYLFWPGGPLPEHIGYSTSTLPTGPWKYGGTIMTTEGGVFTNHQGVIDFRGQTISKLSPLDLIPLYVKGGSILPIGPDVQYAEEKKWDDLEIRVYKGANGTFVLYEDEFDNYNYENGQYSEIIFSWNDSLRTLTIDNRKGSYMGMLQQRNFNIILIEPGKTNQPQQIAYNGSKVSVKL